MSSEAPTIPPTIDQASDAARDEKVARLIDALVEEHRQGRTPDVDAVARQHPELADELRQLWAAAQIALEIGKSIGEVPPAAASPPRSSADQAGRQGQSAEPPRVGDFELVEELGRGGMGVVYRAQQVSLGRTVALKVLLSGPMASAADVVRFRAEAESAARLDHPNIVPVYSVGDHEGRPYFTMKLVDGTTLARRLADGPLPPREAAALLAPICRAVHHAHQRGVLHRDLKPSNVLLEQAEGGERRAESQQEGSGCRVQKTDGQHSGDDPISFLGSPPPLALRSPPSALRPYVTDFGLARRVEGHTSLTQSGAILGTPSYMPPEQAAGNRGRLGPASDVYSLGAILYHMLTGRPPFQAATAVDVVLQVLEQDPLPPRLVNPQADRDLELIALKCLQKPSDLRYPSAAALADDLESYLVGEPVSARSGTLAAVIGRVFRETHHAVVLENWGLLWMWHSLALLVLCVVTNWLQWRSVSSRTPYVALWTAGLGTWATIFWWLRRRSGPVTFVERQIAHVWGASIAASVLLFAVEALLDFPVLKLSPVLALIGAMVFVVKAGILSGTFYLQAAALFVIAGLMALVPDIALSLYGVVSAICFFIPGLKYYRQRTGKREGNQPVK